MNHLLILSSQEGDEGVRVSDDRVARNPTEPALEITSARLDKVGRKASGQALLGQWGQSEAGELLGQMLRKPYKVGEAALEEAVLSQRAP